MLNTSLVGSATIFLQGLMGKNLTLTPVKGTPLAELANCCISVVRDVPANIVRSEGINVESLCFEIVEFSNLFNGKIQTASDHDVYMDRATKMAADIIQRNLNLTRNQVQPMVRDLVEGIELSLQDFHNVTFQTPIVTDKVLDVFTHPFITDMVEELSKDAYYADFPFLNTFPVLGTEAIRELIPSMGSELDIRIQEVLEAIGAERLIEVYTDAFVDGSITLKKYTRNEYILLLLMLNNLISTKPTVLNSKIEEFYNQLYDMRKQTALRVRNDLTRWKEAYDNNRLIISYPETITVGKEGAKDPIVVHEDLYTEWLTAGGEPDLIYGAFFSDRPLNGDEILRERGKYQYEANQYLQQIHAANESKRSAVIRRTMRERMTEIYEEEIKKEGNVLNESNRECFNRKLNDASTLDLDDILGFSTLLVCESFFPNTYAKKIIDGINKYQTQYPTSRVEDLVTLVIADLMVEWVVNMMCIKPLGAN